MAGTSEQMSAFEQGPKEEPETKPVYSMSMKIYESKDWVGEFGKRADEYIFHFYARTENSFSPEFEDKVGDAFLEVYRDPEKLSARHVRMFRCYEGKDGIGCGFRGEGNELLSGPMCPDCHSRKVGLMMDSWAVKVTGFGDHLFGDELALKVFTVLERLLTK